MSSVTWSGSAALGGWIADWSGDYRFTFNVTAMIYTVSLVCQLPLLWLCPPEVPTEPKVESRDNALAAAPTETGAAGLLAAEHRERSIAPASEGVLAVGGAGGEKHGTG